MSTVEGRLFFASYGAIWIIYCWWSITKRWRCSTKICGGWCCIYLHCYIHRCRWWRCRCCRLSPRLFCSVSLCRRRGINPLWLLRNTYFWGCSVPRYFPDSPASIVAIFSLPRVQAAIPKIAPMEM